MVEVYPHTKLDGNLKNFVDVRTDVRTDTPEFQSTRSSNNDDYISSFAEVIISSNGIANTSYFHHRIDICNVPVT